MNTVLIVIGCIIVFYILHRILMNWQINRSIDYLIENADPYVETPEDIERKNVLEMRLEKLRSKSFENEDDLLFDLTTVYILNMIKDESDWSVNPNEFLIKSDKNNKVITRIKMSHPIMKDRVYDATFTRKENTTLHIDNYEVGGRSLDIFNSNLIE